MIQVLQQFAAVAVLQGVAGRTSCAEGIQRLVVPLEQVRLRSALQIRDVQLDAVLLTNAVQAPDALLKQVGVGRQVKHHQMMGELEVAALTADFRADQHLCAKFLICEEGRRAVTLDDTHALVEHGGGDAATDAQGVFQVERSLGVGADHQYLVALEQLEGIDQPLNARVGLPPGLFLTVKVGLQWLLRVERHLTFKVLVLLRAGQGVGVQVALGETGNRGAGVAVEHAAGAMPVEQLAHQAVTRGRRFIAALVQRGEQWGGAVTEPAGDGVAVFVAELILFKQVLHGFGDGLIALRFLDEVLQTVKAIRVEQSQARKVAGLAELLRGGGEQQHGRRLAGQSVDQGVLGARVVLVPDQVMSFVYHQQVPVGLQQIVLCGGVLQQKLQRHQRQLLFLEGVALCAVAAVGVEQGELQVEAAAHFHQPLVLQVLRHHDQHPANAAGLQLAVQNQARLDGLAQAYLVGQQDAGRHAVGDVARNM